MTENPYNPEWIALDDSDENALYEGMKVAFEGEQSDELYTVTDIRHCDGETDGEGYSRSWPTQVEVCWGEGDENRDWYPLSEVKFLRHEYEAGKAAYEARTLLRRYTCKMTFWKGQDRGYRSYGWRGRPVVTAADFAVCAPTAADLDLPLAFIKAAEAYVRDNPMQRKGQAYFNYVHAKHPGIAETIRGTKLDPFHNDSAVGDFLTHVESQLGA
jgi:hypothetical protein